MTAHATIPTAVEALKIGATDYVRKPFDLEDLQTKISYALHVANNDTGDRASSAILDEQPIIGISASINRLRRVIGAAAENDYPVLLIGETGSGCRSVAKWLHLRSPNSNSGNLILIDCEALPYAILEHELGRLLREGSAQSDDHPDCAERWEQALGGTLVLVNADEIGEAGFKQFATNVKPYLRSAQRPHGLRLILTSVQNPQESHAERTHLAAEHPMSGGIPNVITINVPALRNRIEDIPLLVSSFEPELTWEDEAYQALLQHDWPENVAELEQTILYAATLANGSPVTLKHLPPHLHPKSDDVVDATRPNQIILPEDGVDLVEVERTLIEQALDRTDGNKAQAARLLGISRSTLLYRLEKYGLMSTNKT